MFPEARTRSDAYSRGDATYPGECPQHGQTAFNTLTGQCLQCYTKAGRLRSGRTGNPQRAAARRAGAKTYTDDCLLHGPGDHSTQRGQCLMCYTAMGEPRAKSSNRTEVYLDRRGKVREAPNARSRGRPKAPKGPAKPLGYYVECPTGERYFRYDKRCRYCLVQHPDPDFIPEYREEYHQPMIPMKGRKGWAKLGAWFRSRADAEEWCDRINARDPRREAVVLEIWPYFHESERRWKRRPPPPIDSPDGSS